MTEKEKKTYKLRDLRQDIADGIAAGQHRTGKSYETGRICGKITPYIFIFLAGFFFRGWFI